MKTLKTRGLVLKEYETGEADKRLLLLCKEHGRILAYARGARKPRSKFIASAQLFTYSDFVLAAGRGFFSVAQADVIESFYDLRTDYDRLCAAHLIAEVCEKTLLENHNCDELLLLVLKSFSNLTKGKFPPKQIISVFLLKFFDFYGLKPNTETAQSAVFDENIFWGKEGLLYEDSPRTDDVIKISPSAAMAAAYILNSGLERAFSFEASESVLDELLKMSRLLWRNHFETFLSWQ